MRISILIFYLLFNTFTCVGQESHFVKTQDGMLHYEVIGEGKPILIINGGPGFSSEGFKNIATEIALLGYKSILFDQRGTGKSTLNQMDTTTITMSKMALDMEVIRKDIGIDEWILFGHSFGGMLANYYTTKFPNRVSAIIHSSSGGLDLHLIDNAQSNLNSRLTEQEIDSLNFWRNKLRENESEYNRRKFNQYLASAYVYQKKNIPIVSERLMQGNMSLNRMVWDNMLSINFDCKKDLESFDKPVLILQGKQDVIPQSLAFTADKVFSNSNLFFLDNCGHYGWLDKKKEYLNRINDFLIKLKKSHKEKNN
ncbi:alpha/beta hydrolase [Aequorivita sp. F47161]|uniref:Alpha/beta hydrolase n=1 Tax=Aequorivita vitellina TaxID=2874475 RepID=A0A9X1U4P6_9FLAO|nr:alpha/beta hydrolase [Aequorivita vitellina]MCG2420512.1 alpha/beta hydrolase [Aequorivita vitellina]